MNENKISIIPVNVTGMFILSILHFTTYIALVKAIDYSNNPGYVRAFVGLEISILAIFYAIYIVYGTFCSSCILDSPSFALLSKEDNLDVSSK